MADTGEHRDKAWARLVAQSVAAATGHGVEQLAARGVRRGPVKQARWMVFYLAHTTLGWSQERVAGRFGVTRRQVGRACQDIEDARDDPLVDAILSALDRGLREIIAAGAPR